MHNLHLRFLMKILMMQERVCWGDHITIAMKLTNRESKTRWWRYLVTTGQDVKYLYISLLKSLMVTPLLSADWHMGKSPLASCQDDWLFRMQRGLLKNEASAYSAVHYITAFIRLYCIILALAIFTYCVWCCSTQFTIMSIKY